MPQFSAGQVYIESGLLGSSSMQPVLRITNAKIDYNVPRANVTVWSRGKPLEQRPVINYTPVDASFDFLKSDTMVEQSLGLINPSNVTTNLVATAAATATYGIRSMQVYYAPTSSANYNGLYDLKSGVLTSYTLQGGVTEPIRGSFGLQFLDMSGSVNTTARASTNYNAAPIIPANQVLTGLGSVSALLLTGFGLTGVTVQSFALNLGLSHASVMQLGTKFPIERPLTDVNASLQIQGYFEGLNNSITGLSVYDCGYPAFGVIGLTMTPSCGLTSPSSIIMKNPYLDSFSVDGQAGGFSTFAMSFSMPLGPNPLETGDGSVLIMT